MHKQFDLQKTILCSSIRKVGSRSFHIIRSADEPPQLITRKIDIMHTWRSIVRLCLTARHLYRPSVGHNASPPYRSAFDRVDVAGGAGAAAA